ncbi:uncharacterized protein LOC106873986 [Octopus bimaculoides]|uniref:uncharacterized protein LOC106873986 n=1 Tax=Octopus bimaculoides TaxID=37653 RepID=UPI00071E24DD|nr:uncharacterized protein LOC106873986 [Octopus bimaculoides]|eukprot:XP_014777019.1 PREDICTED: uncharacterized protein LOC106873986 [Octopus bimaculoides]
MEKAFHRVLRSVISWSLRKLRIDDWFVKVIQVMYKSSASKVKVSHEYSDKFSVQVSIHQGSVLSPLLLVIVLQAITEEFKTSCPWELMHAEDLIFLTKSVTEPEKKIQV